MKVLQVNKFFPPHIGGIEKVVKDIADWLSKRVKIYVLVCAEEDRTFVYRRDKYIMIAVKSFATWWSMPVSIAFPFILRKISKKLDILHFHLPFPLGVISYILFCPRKRNKLIVSWYSDIVRQKVFLFFYRPFLMKFLRMADVIIVPALSIIDSSSFLPFFRAKCEVIPIGINIKRFEIYDLSRLEELRRRYGRRIVLFVGRLVYYKGVDVLIEAMKDVDATLLILGKGPLEDRCRRLIETYDLKARVFILKDIDDEELVYYYHLCDLFVLPSVEKSEAYGIVQLEAMACGKPVVSTNLPTGVTFINRDSVTGIVVPVGSSSALADAINRLLNDANLRRKYGENARKIVREEFSIEKMADRIYRVYKRVMDRVD